MIRHITLSRQSLRDLLHLPGTVEVAAVHQADHGFVTVIVCDPAGKLAERCVFDGAAWVEDRTPDQRSTGA